MNFWVGLGVSISDPFFLLLYGVLLVWFLVQAPFFDRLWVICMVLSLTYKVPNLEMSTCTVTYEILGWAGVSISGSFIFLLYGVLLIFRHLNLCSLMWNFSFGLRYSSLTGFEIRNFFALKFGFEIWTCQPVQLNMKFLMVWAGVSLLTLLFYCFFRWFMLRYVTMFFCFSSCQPVQLNMKFLFWAEVLLSDRLWNSEFGWFEIRVEIWTCQPVQLNMKFLLVWAGFFEIRNSVGLKFWSKLGHVNLCS